MINMVGQKHNRLTVISFHHVSNNGAHWVCHCECGKETIVHGKALRYGNTKSCGCYAIEARSMSGKRNRTHGFSNTKIYDVYKQMLGRCEKPYHKDYPMYGGRGITVCKEWHDIAEFMQWKDISGYKEGLTIERMDSNAGYSPNNCCWIPMPEQGRNTRRVYYVEYSGERLSISDWARKTGISVTTLIQRKNKGWSPERMLTEVPVIGKNQSFKG